ncbi:MAG TPA: HAD family hydrolase [Nitrospiraceae bacterium]|nr:HAD family hydrolase [Nitrospiraceae bacterium]
MKNGFDWNSVDDVLLDMDGTLLDRDFDNFFFEEELPRRYAALHRLSEQAAREKLFALYRSVEGELAWTDLHYWTRTLGIDVVAMTQELSGRIGYLPGAEAFLKGLRKRRKRVTVLTNAHEDGVVIKSRKTGIDTQVDRIVNAFEVGCLKMRLEYWPACQKLVGFDPARSLYIDDDEACLAAARAFGIRHIYHSARSSTKLPAHPSSLYTALENLQVLMS